ncbi:putative glycoside hydrolase [Coraliomargarita algicola]|uniref:Glycoside hydrolase n=1 Tax=Coraliomargarita algicola TaxID=3092156 RepID=A0ABZ0RJ74_9BACT|nr:putative glycoside hydrolase [Coraliomargarita sp. J2-16]WPJ95523.1 putative glycoside hydrolase [Coraliomargarita sp. J2-16]
MHIRKATEFTPEEIQYLATFPLITLEKSTGHKDFGSTEAGTLKAATAVKAINPRTKILYYRNIIVHYGGYAANAQLESIPNAFLESAQGDADLVRGKVPAYDLSNPAVESWWMQHAKEICEAAVIDGIFVDGNIKVLEDGYLRRDVGAEKKAAVKATYHEMMAALPRVIGHEKLVVANIIRARFEDAGLAALEYFDGSYLEGFEHAVGGMSREDYVAKGIAAMQAAARSGKIIAFTIGMGAAQQSEMGIDESRSGIDDLASIQDRFTYALALFLICAEKYSYFMATDGYSANRGGSKLWMQDIPEYHRPLGKPLGPARNRDYLYIREFEHVRVWLDIEHQRAELLWK